MSEMRVSVPDSLFYYYENKKALDILNKQKNPPLTFSQEKVINFYKAKANLEVCKYEFYYFMCKFHNAAWSTACKKFTEIVPLQYKDVKDTSIEYIWYAKNIYWEYQFGDYKLHLSCYIEDEYKLSIYYSVYNGIEYGNYVKNLKPDTNYWEIDDDCSGICLKSKKMLCFTKEANSVNVKQLSKIATEALENTSESIKKTRKRKHGEEVKK